MNTDKQPQTVYVAKNIEYAIIGNRNGYLEQVKNILLFTTEELEALKAEWKNDKPKDLIEWIEKEGLPMSKDILRELKLSRLARKFGYSSVDEAINDLDKPLPQPHKQ